MQDIRYRNACCTTKDEEKDGRGDGDNSRATAQKRRWQGLREREGTRSHDPSQYCTPILHPSPYGAVDPPSSPLCFPPSMPTDDSLILRGPILSCEASVGKGKLSATVRSGVRRGFAPCESRREETRIAPNGARIGTGNHRRVARALVHRSTSVATVSTGHRTGPSGHGALRTLVWRFVEELPKQTSEHESFADGNGASNH